MEVGTQFEGKQLLVTVTITNDKTGHHIPTDSPMRQLILFVDVVDSNGVNLTQTDGPTLPEWCGTGDPEQGYLAQKPGTAYAKILMELWTEITPSGAYWNPTQVISDNRIPALQSDTTVYSFDISDLKSVGEIQVEVSLLFRRAFINLVDQKDWNTPDILMEVFSTALTLSE